MLVYINTFFRFGQQNCRVISKKYFQRKQTEFISVRFILFLVGTACDKSDVRDITYTIYNMATLAITNSSKN